MSAPPLPEPATSGIDEPAGRAGPLRAGELVLLVDQRDRRRLLRLTEGAELHTHAGTLPHDAIIGTTEGSVVEVSAGARRLRFRVLRPTLADYVLKMPRGAQVIYPKDLGPILMLADIGPGCRVLEAGVGSGALSLAMLRAGADVTGYEIRPDFAARARRNVEGFLGAGAADRYRIQIRDIYEGVDPEGFDRVVLDLPEPERVAPLLSDGALRPGGILCAYNPSIIQVSRLREVLATGPWCEVSTEEVLRRTWHVEGHAVRPDHRMVAHTGFLTTARLAP